MEINRDLTEIKLTSEGVSLNYDWVNPFKAETEHLKTEIRRLRAMLPERYIINDGATILFWKNGEKTIVKRANDDEFNPRLAFLTAFFQRYSGLSKNKANKYLANLQVEENKAKDNKPKKNTKFKVGDIVFNKDFGEGKIINISDDKSDDLPILVEFRRKNEKLHSGFGWGKQNHCYWYDLDTDELTKEEK